MIANFQEQYCKAPMIGIFANARSMAGLTDDTDLIKALVKWTGMAPSRIAKEAGLTPTTVTRPFSGTATTRISIPTFEKLRARFPDFAWARPEPDLPSQDPMQDYVEIEVLPTYAGMGGGGTGDADRETALLPSRLVRDLRAKPQDVILINVRGTSMEPLFRHGDQLLVDRRDTSPTQPGPFALLYSDGYVVKNVSWAERRTKLKIASANPEFEPEIVDPDEVKIMGRPVWFARRL